MKPHIWFAWHPVNANDEYGVEWGCWLTNVLRWKDKGIWRYKKI